MMIDDKMRRPDDSLGQIGAQTMRDVELLMISDANDERRCNWTFVIWKDGRRRCKMLSPFNELEEVRKPLREPSWIRRDIREPS